MSDDESKPVRHCPNHVAKGFENWPETPVPSDPEDCIQFIFPQGCTPEAAYDAIRHLAKQLEGGLIQSDIEEMLKENKDE